MSIPNEAKILILIVLVLLVIYLFMNNSSTPVQNDGSLTQDLPSQMSVTDVRDNNSQALSLETQSNNSNDSGILDDASADFRKKMTSRDSSRGGYKGSSYNKGNRYAKTSSLDKFFEGNSPADANAGAGFTSSVENEGKYAAYLSTGPSKKLSEKDKFDPNSLLPKENNGDWFDDPYETTNIKSSRLINIYRPVGVNTIQTTLKNPSLDIRGCPPNPKYPVSPWNNSSIEPDTNIRNQSLSY